MKEQEISEETVITKEQLNEDWIQKELARLEEIGVINKPENYLKIEENQIVTIDINFNEPWRLWRDDTHKTDKAMIPVVDNGEEKTFSLNIRNKLYRDLLEKHKAEGVTKFKIHRSGLREQTRYSIIKE